MRLFIGIAPDHAACDALERTACLLKAQSPGRFADPSLYHVTLAFLYDVPPQNIPAIQSAMERTAAQHSPFIMQLGSLGSFGSIVYRGFSDTRTLDALSASLRQSLRNASIAFDAKPFRAHITLARECTLPRSMAQAVLPTASYPIRALTLYESRRNAGMLQYDDLLTIPL